MMELSQTEIAKLYLFAWILGAALGFFWDMLRLPRMFVQQTFGVDKPRTASSLRKRRIVVFGGVFLEDFLFCIVAAVSLILLFYEQNNGKVRPFAFFAAAVGFIVYRATLGKPIRRLTAAFLRLVVRAVRTFICAVLKPLRRIARVVGRVVEKRLSILRARIEKRGRKRYTRKMFRLVETTAAGLLPGDCVLSMKKQSPERRKDKQKRYHGRKEKGAKDHRAEQESPT